MHAVMHELDAKTLRWSFCDNVDCSILRTINFFYNNFTKLNFFTTDFKRIFTYIAFYKCIVKQRRCLVDYSAGLVILRLRLLNLCPYWVLRYYVLGKDTCRRLAQVTVLQQNVSEKKIEKTSKNEDVVITIDFA